MLDAIDIAGSLLTLVLTVVVLVMLWITSVFSQRIRVLESRIESLEREQQQFDEEVALLTQGAHVDESSVLTSMEGDESADALLEPPR